MCAHHYEDIVVSMVTGTNEWHWSRWEYFCFFRSSAAAATAPAPLAALGRYDGAKVSGQDASHTKRLPLFHGSTVMPSGRCPSDRNIPDGSKRDGTCAAVRALCTMSLSAACRWSALTPKTAEANNCLTYRVSTNHWSWLFVRYIGCLTIQDYFIPLVKVPVAISSAGKS